MTGYTVVLDYSGVVIVLAIGVYALVKWISTSPLIVNIQQSFCLGQVWRFLLPFWSFISGRLLGIQSFQLNRICLLPPTAAMAIEGSIGLSLTFFLALGFNLRYGLFTSAPFLLLALFIPAWFRKEWRIVEKRETLFILFFSLLFFVFTSANQFARMQFNSGIRHVVPVTPFLFLIVAGVFIKLPRWFQISFGAITLYWSWCLAMYRDVEQGSGIFEALTHITLGGPQLPWLMTLHRLGMAPSWLSAWIFLFLAGILLWGIWKFRFRSPKFFQQHLITE